MAVFDRSTSEKAIDGISWPNSRARASWSNRLQRACRILRGCTPPTIRSVLIVESCQSGVLEAKAVAELAERLAAENGVVISVVRNGGVLKVRLSCRAEEAGDPR